MQNQVFLTASLIRYPIIRPKKKKKTPPLTEYEIISVSEMIISINQSFSFFYICCFKHLFWHLILSNSVEAILIGLRREIAEELSSILSLFFHNCMDHVNDLFIHSVTQQMFTAHSLYQRHVWVTGYTPGDEADATVAS